MDILLQHSTDALQAQEKLSWYLGQNDCIQNKGARENTHACLDSLRQQKAALEGSDKDFELPKVNPDELIELKQLTLMYTPGSLTEEARRKMTSMVHNALEGQCEILLSITLLTCPWWEASQRERGEQAKHNILLVIFMNTAEQFFSPANPHLKEQASIVDLGWFCAVELSHFTSALCRGRSRYFECVFNRAGSEVFSSRCWQELKENLYFAAVSGTQGFLEACLGQAVGEIGKKNKAGEMRLKEGVTICKICESLRLLQFADNSLRLKDHNGEADEGMLPEAGRAALGKIRTVYDQQDGIKGKQELFAFIMDWAATLRSLQNKENRQARKDRQAELDKVLGSWTMRTRLSNYKLADPTTQMISDEHTNLKDLMQKVGGPVASMEPSQIILVAVAGSAMYNLATPSSDVDYLVVYKTPTEEMLSATKKIPETYESRGKDKTIEYGAYEARTFCEMLLKCSVVILELLFAEDHEYMSPLWKDIATNRQRFVTEKAISQYLGLIKNNFKNINSSRHSDSPKRDRKLFYQNFHKIQSIESMLEEKVPTVRVQGEMKDFIMNVRTKDTGEWSRDVILSTLNERYTKLREKMVSRKTRLRENPDYDLCTRWLLRVRGLEVSESSGASLDGR